jgi:hypothetical protein
MCWKNLTQKIIITQQEDGNEVRTLCWVEECHAWLVHSRSALH